MTPPHNDEYLKILTEIKIDMAEMKSDVKHMIDWGSKHDVRDDLRFKEVDIEIDALKAFHWKVAGGVLVAVFAIDIFMKVIFK